MKGKLFGPDAGAGAYHLNALPKRTVIRESPTYPNEQTDRLFPNRLLKKFSLEVVYRDSLR